jgi:hypothetical protein
LAILTPSLLPAKLLKFGSGRFFLFPFFSPAFVKQHRLFPVLMVPPVDCAVSPVLFPFRGMLKGVVYEYGEI